MDTALFYPSYLGLTEKEADKFLAKIVEDAGRFGGCITVNWHDRSLAPERLWTGSYSNLVRQLREKGGWFATAGDAVRWFRARRAASFLDDGAVSSQKTAQGSTDEAHHLPALQVKRNGSHASSETHGSFAAAYNH
jgi:hypothetical protein